MNKKKLRKLITGKLFIFIILANFTQLNINAMSNLTFSNMPEDIKFVTVVNLIKSIENSIIKNYEASSNANINSVNEIPQHILNRLVKQEIINLKKLAITDKEMNKLINSSQITKLLVELFSKLTNKSNVDTALMLNTELLSRSSILNYLKRLPQEQLNNKNMGVIKSVS